MIAEVCGPCCPPCVLTANNLRWSPSAGTAVFPRWLVWFDEDSRFVLFVADGLGLSCSQQSRLWNIHGTAIGDAEGKVEDRREGDDSGTELVYFFIRSTFL